MRCCSTVDRSVDAWSARSTGFVEGGAGGARTGHPDSPPRRTETVAARRDDDQIGMIERRLDRLMPVVDAHHVGDESIEQAVEIAPVRSHPRAYGIADGGGEWRCRPGSTQDHQRTADIAGAERLDSPQATLGIGDDDGRQGVAQGDLDDRFPARIDIDELEQRAEHAVDPDQPFGTGTRSRLAERHLQRIGARLPGLLLAGESSELSIDPGQFGLALGNREVGGVDPLDQAPLPFVGRGEALLDLEPGGGKTSRAGGERIEPGGEPLAFAIGLLGRRPKGGERTADLGCFTRRRSHALAPGLLVVAASGVELALGLGETIGVGEQCLGLGLHGGEVGRQACRLGFECGDDRLVDEGGPLALDGATPLGQQGRQSASSFAQRFVAGHGVAEVIATLGGQTGLGGQDRRVESGQFSACRHVVTLELMLAFDTGALAFAQGGQLPPGGESLERGQLGGDGTVAAGGIGLPLQRAQLATDLTQEILDARHVRLGRAEPALGLLLAPAVLEHAGGFLDDRPPILRAGIEHGVDLALGDDHVLLPTDPGIGQQLLEIEQPARRAVDGVFALTRAEQRAGEGDLGEVDGQQARRVVDGQ